jgi:hypothetical protein
VVPRTPAPHGRQIRCKAQGRWIHESGRRSGRLDHHPRSGSRLRSSGARWWHRRRGGRWPSPTQVVIELVPRAPLRWRSPGSRCGLSSWASPRPPPRCSTVAGASSEGRRPTPGGDLEGGTARPGRYCPSGSPDASVRRQRFVRWDQQVNVTCWHQAASVSPEREPHTSAQRGLNAAAGRRSRVGRHCSWPLGTAPGRQPGQAQRSYQIRATAPSRSPDGSGPAGAKPE